MERLPALISIGFRQINLATYASASLRLTHVKLQNTQYRNAGHSHWANIRHTKGAKDKLKSGVTAQVASRVRLAIQESGGANVKLNFRLARVVEFAEKNNVPSKSIKSMIDKAVSSKDTYVQTQLEVKGPSGSLMIISLASGNTRKTNNDVSRILAKRMGGTLMTGGGTSQYFETKGIIIATPRKDKEISLEQAEEIAISVDAEDVKAIETSESGDINYEITCDSQSLYTVVKGLSETELDVLDYTVMPVPISLVELSEDEKAAVDSSIDAVKSLPDATVDNVYDNIKW